MGCVRVLEGTLSPVNMTCSKKRIISAFFIQLSIQKNCNYMAKF